jgi:hypothetical protein
MTAQQRFMVMVAINVVCVIGAILALVGGLSYHLAYGLPTFVVAIAAGFAAQIWFIASLYKDGRLGKGV